MFAVTIVKVLIFLESKAKKIVAAIIQILLVENNE